MSGNAAVATGIFAVAMVVTLAVGLASARGRKKGLTEWSVSGRGLGVVLIWLLMAGETYTSFSFLGAAGWSFSRGVPILYLVAYLTVGLCVAYVVAPLFWTYARRHNLVSVADIAEQRFGSRSLAIGVALVATVFLIPYVQLQIQGLGKVVEAMTYGAVDAKVAAVIAFVVAQVFVVVSGLRGSTWVAAVKDVLVVAVIVYLIVYLPLHYVGGLGPLFDRLVIDNREWLLFPGHTQPGLGAAWFISTVLLNAVTIVVYPNNVAAYMAARGPNVLRHNSILLPWYQLLLFVPMAIGLTALVAIPTLADPDMALLTLVTDSLPAWLAGVVGVAAALSALVPTSVFMLAIGTLWGRTILGGGVRAARGGDVLTDLRQLRWAQVVCVGAGLFALAGALWAPALLVRLSVLSYEGFAQLVPVVVLGLLWPRMSRAGAWAGMVAGVAVVVALNATGNDPLLGINAGLFGLAANLAVNAAVSSSGARRPAPPSGATPNRPPPGPGSVAELSSNP